MKFDVKNAIRKAMNDLMQHNNRCNYVIITKGVHYYLKDTYSLDSYMRTYELSKQFDDVSCFMAPMGKKAASPVFRIHDGSIFLSGLEIYLDPLLKMEDLKNEIIIFNNAISQNKQNIIEYYLNGKNIILIERY